MGRLEIRKGDGLRPSVPREVGVTRQSCAPALRRSEAFNFIDDTGLIACPECGVVACEPYPATISAC